MYEAIRALEQVGVLSWVNRIKRVREYVPRPVRQPGATTLRGAGSPAALSVGWALARLAGKAASAATGRSNRENRGARNPMQRRCADRPVSPFRRFGNFETTPPPFRAIMGKREPQIILKTDERKVVLELGFEGKFTAKSSGWDENRVFLEATSSRSQSRTAAGCSRTCPRAAGAEAGPHYFPDD